MIESLACQLQMQGVTDTLQIRFLHSSTFLAHSPSIVVLNLRSGACTAGGYVRRAAYAQSWQVDCSRDGYSAYLVGFGDHAADAPLAAAAALPLTELDTDFPRNTDSSPHLRTVEREHLLSVKADWQRGCVEGCLRLADDREMGGRLFPSPYTQLDSVTLHLSCFSVFDRFHRMPQKWKPYASFFSPFSFPLLPLPVPHFPSVGPSTSHPPTGIRARSHIRGVLAHV